MARAEAQVVLPEATPIPAYQFEFPTENQRLVEQSPMRYQLAIPLGPIRTADVNTGIVRVEYFMDGNKVGEAARPTFEIRDVETGPGKTEEHMFQLWQLDDQVPLSSLQRDLQTLKGGAQLAGIGAVFFAETPDAAFWSGAGLLVCGIALVIIEPKGHAH